jgi:cytochrome c
MNIRSVLILAAFTLGAAPTAAFAQDPGDPEQGKQLARKCTICHQIGDSAAVKTGPALTGVIGRQAGTGEGYNASKLSQAAGEAGLVWTEELILQYLPNPKGFVVKFLTEAGKADQAKGAYKMPISFKNEEENRHIVAYLKSLSPN